MLRGYIGTDGGLTRSAHEEKIPYRPRKIVLRSSDVVWNSKPWVSIYRFIRRQRIDPRQY